MGLFNKKTTSKTQREMVREALERGETLSMLSMLVDYGVGNHTAIIARIRKDYKNEGKGYDYIRTEFRRLKAKKSGKYVRVAFYYIPEIQERNN